MKLHLPGFTICTEQRLPSGLILLSVLIGRFLLVLLSRAVERKKNQRRRLREERNESGRRQKGASSAMGHVRREAKGRRRPSLANEPEVIAGTVSEGLEQKNGENWADLQFL